MALAFPDISPTIVEIGPFALRWYALAYIVGVTLGYRLALGMARRMKGRPTPTELDDFLVWAVVGVLAGGRIGFILFYNLDFYLQNPLDMLKVWHGGMSFHGGMAGVALAILLFARRRGFNPLALGDLAAVAAPIGLFLGRLANFVNGELWGRPTDVPWGMVFPHAPDGLPRHPSQLYEAGLEGVVLFSVLFLLSRLPGVRDRTGTLTGSFLIGYALCRITAEFFREPDAQLGFLLGGGVTMGQILSIPMALVGVALVVLARRRAPAAA